jgi:hypothetical protein
MRTVETLTDADIDRHVRVGIDPVVLTMARVRRLTNFDARELLGLNGKRGDFSGIEYPYSDPDTGQRVTSRVRLDHLPMLTDGSTDKKYRQPYGDNRHLYFPPGAAPLLTDTNIPVLFVESEKAALAVTSAANRSGHRVLAIALGGCWNFQGRIGKATDHVGARVDVTGPLPDFHRITWVNRLAIVLFDARPNASVCAARRAFGRVLRRLGADVQHAHLPNDDLRVNGPDDYVGMYGDDALWRVIDSARTEEFVRDKRGRIIANDLGNVRAALARLGSTLVYVRLLVSPWSTESLWRIRRLIVCGC